jgi:hypothetical protein
LNFIHTPTLIHLVLCPQGNLGFFALWEILDSLPSGKYWKTLTKQLSQIQLSESASSFIETQFTNNSKGAKAFSEVDVREKIFKYIGLQANAKMVKLPMDIPVKVRQTIDVHSLRSVGHLSHCPHLL